MMMAYADAIYANGSERSTRIGKIGTLSATR